MRLNSKIVECDSVVLLGAGASAAFGYPVMTQLADACRVALKEDAEYERAFRPFLQRWNLDLDDTAPTPKQDTKAKTNGPKREPDIEHLLEQLNLICHLDLTSEESSLAQRVQQRLIAYIRAAVECVRSDHAAVCEHYGKVFDAVEPSGLIPIFTTNYDNVIEVLADKLKVRWHHGFFENRNERKFIWSASRLHQLPLTDESHALPPPPGFHGELVLFKLHGSLDWYREASGEVVSLPYPPRDHFDAVALYPAETKLIFRDPYFTSFMYFDECLRNARLLVVIGYSFADAALRERLRSALATNPRLEVLWFTRGETELDLTSQEVKSIPYPLGERTDDLVREIRSAKLRQTQAARDLQPSFYTPQVITLEKPRVPFSAGQQADFQRFDVSGSAGFQAKIRLPDSSYWRTGFILANQDYLRDGDATRSIVERFLFHIGRGHQASPREPRKTIQFVAYTDGKTRPISWRGVKSKADLEFEWTDDYFLIDATFIRETGVLALSVGSESFAEKKSFAVDRAYFRYLYLLAWADGIMPFKVTIEFCLKV